MNFALDMNCNAQEGKRLSNSFKTDLSSDSNNNAKNIAKNNYWHSWKKLLVNRKIHSAN